jgi:hypothetical protein
LLDVVKYQNAERLIGHSKLQQAIELSTEYEARKYSIEATLPERLFPFMMDRYQDSDFDRLEALCSVSAMLIEQEKLSEGRSSRILNESEKREDADAHHHQNADPDQHRSLSQSEAQCQSYNSASDGSQLNSISHLASLTASESDGTTNCGKASFIAKLCEMLNDEASDGLVRWGVEGRSIVVTDPNGFSQVMLPRYVLL